MGTDDALIITRNREPGVEGKIEIEDAGRVHGHRQ